MTDVDFAGIINKNIMYRAVLRYNQKKKIFFIVRKNV